jgi:hypothetical protein
LLFSPHTVAFVSLLMLAPLVSAAPAFNTLLQQHAQNLAPVELLNWLQQQEIHYSQNPEYNRWTAELALRENRPELALAALERLIVQEPHNMGARLDLALVCFHLGDYERSRQLLNSLPRDLAPPTAQQTIDQLNAHLPQKQQGLVWYKPRLSWALGYDSNVNIGSDKRDIPLHLWGEIPAQAQLGDASLSQADYYSEISLHSGLGNPQYPHRWWTGGMSHRIHRHASDYDQTQIWLGAQWQQPQRGRSFSLLLNQLWLGNTHWESGVQLDAIQVLAPQHQLQGRVSWTLQHQTALPAQKSLMLAYHGQAYGLQNRTELTYTHRPDHTAGDLMRLNLTLAQKPWPSTQVLLGYEHRQDANAFSPQFFGSRIRTDQTYSAGLSHNLKLPRPLELSLTYQNTHSTIPLFDTQRIQFQASLSFDL